MNEPICIGCNKRPDELDEYREAVTREAWGEGTLPTPAEYVRMEEGTYNPENGHFLCTPCYVKAGMPSGPRGWHAP